MAPHRHLIVLSGLFLLLLNGLSAQDDYYYNGNEKVFFREGDPQVARIGISDISASDLDHLLQETGIVRPDSYTAMEGQVGQLEVRLYPPHTADELWCLLWANERIDYVSGQFYQFGSNHPFYFTREIVVRLKKKESVERFRQLVSDYGLNIGREDLHRLPKFLLVATSPDIDIINTANRLYETGLFEYCCPDILKQYHFY